MSRFRHERLECKVYVGDLSTSASKQDVEDAFSYYGNIRNVWVARNPPGFAFVEYEDVRDAEDAVREVDGRRSVCGRKVRVERAGDRRMNNFQRGGYRPYRGGGGYRGRGSNNGRPFHPDDRCYQCGRKGHYARDCDGHRSGGRHGRSYSRSNSRDRSSRSRSRGYRSRSRDRHSRSRRSRSDDRRSKSNDKKSRDSRSRSLDDRKNERGKSGSYDNRKNRSHSSSKSRSRSRSEVRRNGDSSSNHKDE